MEHHASHPEGQVSEERKNTEGYLLPLSIIVSSVLFAGAWVYQATLKAKSVNLASDSRAAVAVSPGSALEEKVIPSQGVILPVSWGTLGGQLVREGVIDANKFMALYQSRGAFTEEYRTLLAGESNEPLVITPENSGYLLNLFWALGLANANPVLTEGEMVNPRYGGAGRFASTGGWTLAKGDAMEHYARHPLVSLTEDQQKLVDRVSRGIYRPCCGNSTYFPDCNHGMAMLGLLELMASHGVSEEDMWKAALAVNSYWFPDTYLTLASYMEQQGIEWDKVDPKEILGEAYSSAAGYRTIMSQVNTPSSRGGGSGCGVDAGVAPSSRSQTGCGI